MKGNPVLRYDAARGCAIAEDPAYFGHWALAFGDGKTDPYEVLYLCRNPAQAKCYVAAHEAVVKASWWLVGLFAKPEAGERPVDSFRVQIEGPATA